MDYIIKLETAKKRIIMSMDSFTEMPRGWRPNFPKFPPRRINLAGASRRVIDQYYSLKQRIRPQERQELKSWFNKAYDEFGSKIYRKALEQIVENIRHHILSPRE